MKDNIEKNIVIMDVNAIPDGIKIIEWTDLLNRGLIFWDSTKSDHKPEIYPKRNETTLKWVDKKEWDVNQKHMEGKKLFIFGEDDGWVTEGDICTDSITGDSYVCYKDDNKKLFLMMITDDVTKLTYIYKSENLMYVDVKLG